MLSTRGKIYIIRRQDSYRGIPLRSVSVTGDIRGYVPADSRTVDGGIHGVDWFKEVEGSRIAIEHFAEE